MGRGGEERSWASREWRLSGAGRPGRGLLEEEEERGDENAGQIKREGLQRRKRGERSLRSGSSFAQPLLEAWGPCQGPHPQIPKQEKSSLWEADVSAAPAEGRCGPFPAPAAPTYLVGGRVSAEISSADGPLMWAVLPYTSPECRTGWEHKSMPGKNPH